MGYALWILAMIAGIGSLVCWILALVAMFKANQIWQGIVGIICPLFAFIWGWMQVNQLGLKKVMQIWTILIIAGFILNIAAGAMMASSGDFNTIPGPGPVIVD